MVVIIFVLIVTVINEIVLTGEGENAKTRYAKWVLFFYGFILFQW